MSPELPEVEEIVAPVSKLEKPVTEGYSILGKPVEKATVKALKTDEGGEYYVYDLYDSNGKLVALNRYVFKSNEGERPFAALSKADDDSIKPVVSEVQEELI